MAYTEPSTVATGDLATADIQNTQIVASIIALHAGEMSVASQAAGDLLYASSSTQLARVAIGAANTVLLSNGSAPTWSTNVPLLNAANVFTNVAPMQTAAESWVGPSSTTGIYFKGGTVGIGTTVPARLLEVSQATTAYLRLNSTGALGGDDHGIIEFYKNDPSDGGTGLGAFIAAYDDSSNGTKTGLRFATSSGGANPVTATEKVRIVSEGNVGIGETAPACKLVVNGGLTVGDNTDAGDNNVYVVGDVSALTFTDRTPMFVGDAVAALKPIKATPDGALDHISLPDFARHVKGRALGAMVSLLTVACQQLDARVEALEAV